MQKEIRRRTSARSKEFGRKPTSFREAFIWVFLAHLILLAILALFKFPEHREAPPALMQLISLPPAHASGSRSHEDLHLPTPPTHETPTPPVSQPTVTQPVEPPVPPTPAPVRVESQAESRVVLPPKAPEKPQPVANKPDLKPVPVSPPAPEKPKAIKTPKKPKHTVVVDLHEATRTEALSQTEAQQSSSKTKRASPEHPSSSAPGPTLTPSDIASELGETLQSSGATKSIGGIAVGGGGGSSSQFGAFYKIIQEQMYEAWQPPPELVNFKPTTVIQIHVGSDGTIIDAKVVGSSGNARFDESVLQAARKVGRLRAPRPDGCPEYITVNFHLT